MPLGVCNGKALAWESTYNYVATGDFFRRNFLYVFFNNMVTNISSIGSYCITIQVISPYDGVSGFYKA